MEHPCRAARLQPGTGGHTDPCCSLAQKHLACPAQDVLGWGEAVSRLWEPNTACCGAVKQIEYLRDDALSSSPTDIAEGRMLGAGEWQNTLGKSHTTLLLLES